MCWPLLFGFSSTWALARASYELVAGHELVAGQGLATLAQSASHSFPGCEGDPNCRLRMCSCKALQHAWHGPVTFTSNMDAKGAEPSVCVTGVFRAISLTNHNSTGITT